MSTTQTWRAAVKIAYTAPAPVTSPADIDAANQRAIAGAYGDLLKGTPSPELTVGAPGVVPEAAKDLVKPEPVVPEAPTGHLAAYEAPNITPMDRLQSLLSEYAPNLIGGAAGTAGGYALSSLMDDDPDEEGISPEERQRRRSANRRRAALFSLGGAGVGAAAPYLNERFDILNNIKSRLG